VASSWIDQAALLAHQRHPVGIPVKRDADIGAMHNDACPKSSRVSRPAIAIDVQTVGRNADWDHLGTQFPKHGRRDLVGSAIGTIDNDLELRKVKAPLSRPLDRLNVTAVSIIQPLGAPDRRRRA
jgi:hypothetical protein